MVRLALLLLVVVVVLLVVQVAGSLVRTLMTHRRSRGGHPVSTARRAPRRLPAPARHLPNRDEIVAFLTSHHGVEAFLEPKTTMSSLTVVLIDDDGEWRRFPIDDDRELRRTASSHHVPVYDASVMGYPERMRRRKDRDGGQTP